jgi:nucleoside-diphosphate-sugar epimerase
LLVKELLKGGHSVSILHRGVQHDFGKRVQNVQADRNDPAAIKTALEGKGFEVVFDNVYDWQHGTTAAQVEATARAAGNVRRYIFMSSVAAYGDGLNHHEGDALAPDDYPDPYVRNKAASERMLFRMHQRSGFPVVTMRPPFIYGPGNPFYREAFFWDRLRDGRPIIVPGDGRRLMQFIHVSDLVAACIKAMDAPDAAGHAFNIANARALTQVETVQTLAAAAGKEARIVRVPRDRIARAGGTALGPKLYFAYYFDMPPITMVINKAQRMLKLQPRPIEDGFRETYRWWRRANPFPPPDYEFEDSLIAGAPPEAWGPPPD